MRSPYSGLSPKHFWRSGVCESDPHTIEGLYEKKFSISAEDKVATGGSCFAQRVANFMRASGFKVMDVEPPPAALPPDVAKTFGYNIYSARYGNIYTVRQLLQLARDAQTGAVDPAYVWEKDGRFYDALRPNVEPDGFVSVEETLALRRDHLAKVKQMLDEMNVFIFTFGLTEAWLERETGRVFPTAPGTIAGDYDPERYEFKNFNYNEIYDDFVAFQELVRQSNPDVRFILTVSPVPMTATATEKHVLIANTYLKSLLRTVAGALSDDYAHIDYFPGYEMVATPFSKAEFYEDNMRLVSHDGLTAVMRVFFDQHGDHRSQKAKAVAAVAERRAAKKEARGAPKRDEARKPAAQGTRSESREERKAARQAARAEKKKSRRSEAREGRKPDRKPADRREAPAAREARPWRERKAQRGEAPARDAESPKRERKAGRRPERRARGAEAEPKAAAGDWKKRRDAKREAQGSGTPDTREQRIAEFRGKREERKGASKPSRADRKSGKIEARKDKREKDITKEEAVCEDILLDAFAPSS